MLRLRISPQLVGGSSQGLSAPRLGGLRDWARRNSQVSGRRGSGETRSGKVCRLGRTASYGRHEAEPALGAAVGHAR